MHNKNTQPLKPGKYQFRANPFTPWVNVQVFRDSFKESDKLKVRWVGVEIDVEKIANRGEWKPL